MKNKSLVLLCLSFIISVNSYAQQASPTPLLYSGKTIAEMKRIQSAALSSDYAYRQTAYLSNNIGPRLSGSLQAERAVQYVAIQLKTMGLDVRLQKIMVPHWVRGEETGELVEYEDMAPGTTQKIVLTAIGGSVATPAEGLTAEVVVVNSFDELNALGRNRVKGKIVLFNYKFDRDLAAGGFGLNAYFQTVGYRGGGANAAARLGAVAVLVRSAGGSQNRLAHTGALRYADDVTPIPAAAVSFEDAETIAYLSKLDKVRAHIVLTPKTLPDAVSYNVIADLKGSEKPDEVVIVSGHLDSWDLGTGALDDACGVAVSMQTANLLKQLGFRPKRTIRVIAWMNEENGSRGSNAYFEEQKGNLGKHFAALESDLGASHPMGILFTAKPEVQAYLAPISNILLSQGAGIVQLQPFGVGADIGPLTAQGVPSFAPFYNTQTYFSYHHTAADTMDKVDPRGLAESASVMAVLAYGLANLEQPLPR